MKIRLLPLIAMIALTATSVFAIEPGEKAPAFTLTDHTGESHSLSDFEGKTVVLEWTCTKCPFVVDIYDRAVTKSIISKFDGNDDLVYLLVDSSNFATAEMAAGWVDKYDLKTKTLIDASGEVGKAYGAKRTPQVVVIDSEGIVQYNGAIDDNAFGRNGDDAAQYTTDAIKAVLAGEAVATPKTKAWGCSVKYGKAADKAASAPEGATPAMSCCAADKTKAAKKCGEGCDKPCCADKCEGKDKSACAEKCEGKDKAACAAKCEGKDKAACAEKCEGKAKAECAEKCEKGEAAKKCGADCEKACCAEGKKAKAEEKAS